ncbi:trypsin-like peptidase domain-containing protein [Sphingobium sp. AR-3-1]|uniref:Trypsin-like peptidase domain-containing protein n=1 Tax=Sphingobium psychrophilum TaxID=2728834 RepID=A0A7X9WYJ4_9SPHN|nr:serine protease [Sphingobium psychrophilum]NML11893.1 trypsin-like peptidase domain-containing protein [Sphingobium psychrophilum]
MAKSGCGCLPFALGGLLLIAWFGQDVAVPPLKVEQYDPRSPRRPMPDWSDEQFVIEDNPNGPADSMGTAFAVDRDGAWLTAQHVTHGCARVGLEDGRYARPVLRVIESREADAALVPDSLPSDAALPLSRRIPQPGTPGYHMGFPAGEPTLVMSELIGEASARRGRSDLTQPILAWAEKGRIPSGDGTLSGISGGPVFAEDGHVVGVNSASTDRRGRILTTAPDAVARLTAASRAVDDRPVAYPFAGLADAESRFTAWLDAGVIRRIFCDVDEKRGG